MEGSDGRGRELRRRTAVGLTDSSRSSDRKLDEHQTVKCNRETSLHPHIRPVRSSGDRREHKERWESDRRLQQTKKTKSAQGESGAFALSFNFFFPDVQRENLACKFKSALKSAEQRRRKALKYESQVFLKH